MTDQFIEAQDGWSHRSIMSASDTKRLESIEKLLNYVLYILIFEAGLTIGLVYLMQQLVASLTY
jgi:hypothetical protein